MSVLQAAVELYVRSRKMLPTFIDIEASGLGNTSFPIEVAWNDSEGAITNRLVKPVADWTSWDPEAERIHGITRDELDAGGISPAEMCALIRESLSGASAYSDAPELERFWLNRLFQAGEGVDCPILILGVSKVPQIRTICYERGLYDRLKKQAVDEVGIVHRADADVSILMNVFEQAKVYSETRSEQDVAVQPAAAVDSKAE